jgi:crotonobetainyl-CoA:carnitine CoA-transferase CaiB-like acyl-CoA transferase
MPSPLSSIRVIDMSRVLAGPWAGQLLGDFGADVIKIERPSVGDDTRQWGPPWLDDEKEGESAYFLSTNRNKRSVTIDISCAAGQRLVRELVTHADVLIENFKVGTLDRYGLSADELQALNPRLIHCSISAYGQTSSRAAEPGYDAVVQAAGGLMSITGTEGDDSAGPQKVGVAIADIMAGMYAASAVLAALNARHASGRGQHIDIPLYDSQVAWLANQNLNYLVSGKAPGRLGTAHPNLVPYQAFRAADGDLMLAVGNDRQFAACAECLGEPSLATDERFSRNSDRVANRTILVERMQEALQRRPLADWLDAFARHRVPAAPINTIEQVFSDAYASERELVKFMTNSAGQQVPTVANPVDFSQTEVTYSRAPPLLGEHTDEVLHEWLGYSDAAIDELRESSAI